MCVCIVLLLFASCCLAGIAYTDNSNTTHRCVHPLALSAHYFFISNTFVQRTDLTYSYIHKLPTLSVSYLALHSKWVVKCLLHTFALLLCQSLSLYCCFFLDANFLLPVSYTKQLIVFTSFCRSYENSSFLAFVICCCFRKFFSDCNFSQPFHLCLHLFYYIFISFLILLLALLRQTFTSIEFSFEFYFCTLSFIICFVLLISWVRLTAI